MTTGGYMSQNAFGGRIGSHSTSKIQHQISLLTPQFSSQYHPPSLQPRAGVGGKGEKTCFAAVSDSPPRFLGRDGKKHRSAWKPRQLSPKQETANTGSLG